jgi:hypothetical protein
MFPCTAAWVLMLGLLLVAVFRLPPASNPFRIRVSPQLWTVAWLGVLALCVTFQPMRAQKNSGRAATAFVDDDFGHKDLPIVFENSWYFVQRAFYGQGREYALLIDREAADADPGWYTRCYQRFYECWYPKYHKANIRHVVDLPAEFLAVDDDYTTTFEWVFSQLNSMARSEFISSTIRRRRKPRMHRNHESPRTFPSRTPLAGCLPGLPNPGSRGL